MSKFTREELGAILYVVLQQQCDGYVGDYKFPRGESNETTFDGHIDLEKAAENFLKAIDLSDCNAHVERE